MYHISGFWQEPSEETDVLGTGKFAVKPDLFKYDSARKTLPNVAITPEHPEKKDVIVLARFHSDGLAISEFLGTGQILSQGLDSNLTVKKDAEVSLDQITHLDGYGTVIWFGHGNFVNVPYDSRNHGVPILLTGEFLKYTVKDDEPVFSSKMRSADYASGRLLTAGSRAVVTPDFFHHYYHKDALKDSLWFLGACCSMTGRDLADVLVHKGAGAVFGMSEPSRVLYAEKVCFEILINSMMLSAAYAEEALQEAVKLNGRSRPISKKLWPDGIGAIIMRAGNPHFRLVEMIDDAPDPETPVFPDDPDFRMDNDLIYSSYTDTDGQEKLIAHGQAGNVFVTVPASVDGKPVTAIDRNGFRMAKHLRSLSLPETITEIPDLMCKNCAELQSVSLPFTASVIGKEAFYGCSSLERISIPGSVTKIGQSAFRRSGITEFDLPSSLTEIGASAFAETPIRVFAYHSGNRQTELNATFYGCTELERVILDVPADTLYGTFIGCEKLSYVEFPRSLKMISSCFRGCSSLSEITVPFGVETIDAFAFSECGGLEKLTIPGSVTVFGQDAASHCPKLTTVVFADGLKEIGNYAFSSDQALTDVQLPADLEKIGINAFERCTALQSLAIPDTVQSIGAKAFYECVKLKLKGLPISIQQVGLQAFYRMQFALDMRTPYLEIPQGMQELNLTAFDRTVNLSGLIIRNAHIVFTVPEEGSGYSSVLKTVAQSLTLYAPEDSTAQAFAEDPAHPSKFVPLSECPALQ